MSLLHIVSSTLSRRFFFTFYKFLFSGLIRIFGLKITFFGNPNKKKVLFVSNHISYLDIIILGSAVNAIFVAKSEIKNWPVINKLCALGKTIFVERENYRSIKKQTENIKDSLQDGFNVILFPEGTSSDGSKVLKFKSSLFELIDGSELRDFYIQPISISYNKLDGLPLDKNYRPFLAWFGSMDLVSHAWKFLGLGLSEVNVHFHKSKKFSEFINRKQACNFCYEKISQQVINDFRSLEIDDKIKLNEFKFL
tara:strand:- start:1792 stop:2547 length:756 start_codon:yes stop_codon:yes gene_type:complete